MSIFHKGKKYYIIAYNTFYEARFKNEFEVYNTPGWTFNTRVGDLHLINNQTFFGIPHWITESREEMLLELGVRIYRGSNIRRIPFTNNKHKKYV